MAAHVLLQPQQPAPALLCLQRAQLQVNACAVGVAACWLGAGARATLRLRTLRRLHVWTFTVSKCFPIGKMVRTGGGYSRSSSAQARAAAADRSRLAPAAAGALGPPGLELLMDPVEIIPAEQEFSLVTTEKVLDAGTAVALRVRPDNITVCVPAAVAAPLFVYVTSEKLILGVVAGPVGVMTAVSTPMSDGVSVLHAARPDAPTE